MDSRAVGNFISMRRKELNMTQQQLADKLSVTNKAVSKWETGEGYPDITILPELSRSLNVSADELLSGESPKGINDAPKLQDGARVRENFSPVKTKSKLTASEWLNKHVRIGSFHIFTGVVAFIAIAIELIFTSKFTGFKFSASVSYFFAIYYLIHGIFLRSNNKTL